MVNRVIFCAVIEPHVSHSCASELSTGLSLQQLQAASCKLPDSVCATLLMPAALGMRIDSLRKSFIKMPWLPTVQAPAGCKRTFNAVAMPIANCRGPGRRVVCLWHKLLPVAAICIVNLFGALAKRPPMAATGVGSEVASGKWHAASGEWSVASGRLQVAGCKCGQSQGEVQRIIFFYFFILSCAATELASHLAT